MEILYQTVATVAAAGISAVVGALVLVIRSSGPALVQALIQWLLERTLASRNVRIGAAAETVAVEIARGVGDTAGDALQEGVDRLQARLGDTLAKVGADRATLTAVVMKALERRGAAGQGGGA